MIKNLGKVFYDIASEYYILNAKVSRNIKTNLLFFTLTLSRSFFFILPKVTILHRQNSFVCFYNSTVSIYYIHAAEYILQCEIALTKKQTDFNVKFSRANKDEYNTMLHVFESCAQYVHNVYYQLHTQCTHIGLYIFIISKT